MRGKGLRGRKPPVKSKVSFAHVQGLNHTETFTLGGNLSKEDLEVATDLWDNTINPACIAFEERTGKPAEAMREAIAGVIARRTNRPSNWNSWQRIWWHRLPKVNDKTFRSKTVTSNNCPLD